jgi:hypothetical protein
MESKKFHIGDLLSITDGALMCPRLGNRSHPIDGVYEILNFMSGDNLFTHALPRVADECKPVLLDLYPWLAEITVPRYTGERDMEKSWDWVEDTLKPIAAKYGEWHEVWPLHQEDHEVIHPLDEPILDGKEIIEFEIPSEDDPPTEGDINWHVN